MEYFKNIYSHYTAKLRENPSMPTRKLLDNGFLKGEILDYGCGFGKDVEFLREKNFNIVGYDPYYFPVLPSNKFDTIICNYVLNILTQ